MALAVMAMTENGVMCPLDCLAALAMTMCEQARRPQKALLVLNTAVGVIARI